jgi:hypothetical protein
MSDDPKKRSRAWIGWASSPGLLYLLVYLAVFSFILGVCVTEAIVETFCPQWDNVIWIRFAGGIGVVVLAFGFELRFGLGNEPLRWSLFGAGLLLIAAAKLVWCALRP